MVFGCGFGGGGWGDGCGCLDEVEGLVELAGVGWLLLIDVHESIQVYSLDLNLLEKFGAWYIHQFLQFENMSTSSNRRETDVVL